MYNALVNCTPEMILKEYQEVCKDLEQEYRGASLEQLTTDITELWKFFRVCAKRGLGLLGNYLGRPNKDPRACWVKMEERILLAAAKIQTRLA